MLESEKAVIGDSLSRPTIVKVLSVMGCRLPTAVANWGIWHLDIFLFIAALTSVATLTTTLLAAPARGPATSAVPVAEPVLEGFPGNKKG